MRTGVLAYALLSPDDTTIEHSYFVSALTFHERKRSVDIRDKKHINLEQVASSSLQSFLC